MKFLNSSSLSTSSGAYFNLAGCAGGVGYVKLVPVSECGCPGDVIKYVNLETGAVTDIEPTGFTVGECTPPAPSGMVTDEFTAALGQTLFGLTETPFGYVMAFIDGIRLPKAAISITGKDVTYIPANNGGSVLPAGKRVTFDYVA